MSAPSPTISLSQDEFILHFSLPISFGLVAAVSAGFGAPWPAATALLLPGVALGIRQWRSLRFERYETEAKPSECYRRVLRLANEFGWTIMETEPNRRIIAEVEPGPEDPSDFYESLLLIREHRRSGERVEVVFESGLLFVNSMVRPGDRTHLFRLGQRDLNRRIVTTAIGAL